MKLTKTQLKEIIREELSAIEETENLNEAKVNPVVLSNKILDFLQNRGIIDGLDAQKVHKDLTAFLKKEVK